MHHLQSLTIWGFLTLGAVADEQYKSRPDLSPPRLNITIPATEDVGAGYIFVCPYSGFTKGNGFDGPEQPAGYIFRNNGDLVWSSMGFLTGWVGNMQVSTWKGQPVISAFQGSLDSFHGHGFGHPTILNQNYENIRDLHGGNHKIISIHEFNILDSGSALVEVYQPTQIDLSPYGGAQGATWIVDAIFQEIDLETGKLLFEWSSLQHVSPSDSAVSLALGHAGDGQNSTSAWDYFHINSVDKDSQGNYLISARHASALYKVNGKTGEIMWKLGGQGSSFTYAEDLTFGFQHDARFAKKSSSGGDVEFVSLFDNAARANGHRGGGVEIVHSKSRAKVIRLDTSKWTASIELSLASPDKLLAPSQGNVQALSNGNIFVNWGQGGAVTEYRASDGEAIFHAYLDSGEIGEGVQSYRGFRFPWNGFPNETPSIVSLVDANGVTIIYVSWNGDTETTKWQFYAVPASCVSPLKWFCKPRLLGEAKRTGFETSFTVKDQSFSSRSQPLVIYAEAFDARGRHLISTEGVLEQEPGKAQDVVVPNLVAQTEL
ncbi:ASST-domain-containing protein [Ilyonectria sp. MPI-CAGE-AT-0026]|nr:ASST-domain-containing protein [Ilyonectria sp. MPI-CAGE-AT-0026]